MARRTYCFSFRCSLFDAYSHRGYTSFWYTSHFHQHKLNDTVIQREQEFENPCNNIKHYLRDIERKKNIH